MPVDRDPPHPAAPDVRLGDAQINFHGQRALVVGAGAVGMLRRELVAALGPVEARRRLTRFGFAHGFLDALALRDEFAWHDPLDGIRLGAQLHAVEGMVRPELLELIGPPEAPFAAKVLWRDSFEAEQRRRDAGPAPGPQCWMLEGYASGFASACLDREVSFRETSCAAVEGDRCVAVGRDAEGWARAGQPITDAETRADLMVELRRWHEGGAARDERATDWRGWPGAWPESGESVRERVERWADHAGLVLVSPELRKAWELGARVAPTDASVLVCGESGTGKESLVRLIHEHSARAAQLLVSVNCAAMTDTLLESELFGHVRGAFTDAIRDRAGLFETARSGTLFLDEVGEMSPALQAKLLRALEGHEIRPVGSDTGVTATPRIIAATNRDLRAAVRDGAFREDLYYRLAGFVIVIPPLRKRGAAIPALAQSLLRRAAAKLGRDVPTIAPDAMRALVAYPWPGNVRELQHAIEHALILSSASRITSADLPEDVREPARAGELPETFDLAAHERALIERALAEFGGNRRQAAEALRISPVTLWRRLKRHGARAPQKRRG